MHIRNSLKLAAISLLAGFVLWGGFYTPASAQAPTLRTLAPAFKAQLDTLTPQLRSFEQRFNARAQRITSAKSIAAGDLEDAELEKAMETYAEAMKNAFDAATRDARQAADSKGAQGNIGNLRAFEDLAKSHAASVNRLQARSVAIQSQLKSGAIKLDRPLMERATPQQRGEFRQFLRAPARRELLKDNPALFPRRGGNLLDMLQLADLGDSATFWGWVEKREQLSVQACVDWLASSIISPAEAAIALPCVALCFAQQWVACANCVINAGPAAVRAYNNFVRCWNELPGKPWWMPRWLFRAGCLAVLVGRLG